MAMFTRSRDERLGPWGDVSRCAHDRAGQQRGKEISDSCRGKVERWSFTTCSAAVVQVQVQVSLVFGLCELSLAVR